MEKIITLTLKEENLNALKDVANTLGDVSDTIELVTEKMPGSKVKLVCDGCDAELLIKILTCIADTSKFVVENGTLEIA